MAVITVTFHSNKSWKLNQWDRVMHMVINRTTIIGSDNGLLPGWHQAVIWPISEIVLIGTFGKNNCSETLIEMYTFSFKKMHLRFLSENCWTFCLGLNVLTNRDKEVLRTLCMISLFCTPIQYSPEIYVRYPEQRGSVLLLLKKVCD